ncbi:hypothetical protein SARC_04658 [Sphaeroforma arctica JP610]|uniref:NADH-cytochrome b5 reductase n=1 Tax=Sphaeroforma arctica JP610 TaxID=667725 RepID=A0A0L0G2Q6_9EUKA|nr:hypothetical protein SARC_04658 [Sphaeroforma arctica JP610]KNC83081.1 hypothetical protein SARC_04658 [Sphaeroforma arctica JP610]|eukprot:XP_014156983.1 hypothetical protein SARC_04658 [Sphaeroforma arctica JP610]
MLCNLVFSNCKRSLRFSPTHTYKFNPFLSIRNMSVSPAKSVPDTLVSGPNAHLVAPGKCQFGSDFTSVSLLKRWKVSETSSVLQFSLPKTDEPLNLSTCACILAKADLPDRDGKTEAVIRPYTPISTNSQVGTFDLLVKNYGKDGRMSTHLVEELKENDTVEFKHIDKNVKIQAPFDGYKKIGMIVGGTGITPMIQALHAILGDETSKVKATMLYGSKMQSDILAQDMLDNWVKHDRLELEYVLSDEPEDSDWKGERGFITKDLIKKHLFSPEDKEGIIFVCGPPPLYQALCGPRDSPELTGALKEMGYTSDQVFKF